MSAGSIVTVNRNLGLDYPDFTRKIIHPEFDHSGPRSFDVTKLGRQFHDCQKTGISAYGHRIYNELKKRNALQYCLNLADLLAIKERGIKFYQEYFGEDIVLTGWKTIIDRQDRQRKNHPFHPYLKILGPWLVFDWGYLEASASMKQPVFFFSNEKSNKAFKNFDAYKP